MSKSRGSQVMGALRTRAAEIASPLGDHAPTLVVVAFVALLGCAVDDRALELATGGTKSPTAGGEAGDGVGGRKPSAGGSSTMEPVELPRCVYEGSVADECDTLVENAGFEVDTTGWTADDGSYGNWEDVNASGSSNSGALGVLNLLHGRAGGVAPGAARQCVPVSPGRLYDFAADLFIPEGQGEGIDGEMFEGSSGVGVFFFAGADCAGESIANVDSKMITETGVWVHVTGTAQAPESAVSMRVRLNTLKPMRQFAFKTSFDNVFVRER